MLTDQQMDKLIRAAIREEIDGQEVPPQARERVRKALGLNQPKLHRRRFSIVAFVAASALFLILSACLVFPNKATAIGISLIRRLEYLVKDRLYNISETYSAVPSSQAPPHAPDIDREEKVSLDEARSRLPFVLLVPKYLPESSVLTDISLSGSKPLMEVTLVYTGKTGVLKIKQSGISDNIGMGTGYDGDDTKVEKVSISNVQANLLTNKAGNTLLFWHEQGVTYRIGGPYSPEEIIKVANSLSP
ncbi:DUF4367 domain-containing protein [Moorellaceae bacterium AZ2]